MGSMDKKGLIIFDFDGVIVDSTRTMFKYTKRSIPFMSWKLYQEIFDARSFFKAIGIYNTIRRSFQKRTPEEVQKRRSAYTKEKLETCAIVPGMEKLLQALSKEYTLAVNTNSQKVNCVPLLEKYGLTQYFSKIETGDRTSSKAEKNIEILNELGFRPVNALFITDSIRDVLFAKDAGILSIGVLSGVHEKRHFERRRVRKSVVAVAGDAQELERSIRNYFEHEEHIPH